MFSNDVIEFFNRNGNHASVPNYRRTKNYSVRLYGNLVELLDRPGLESIPLSVFDKVEECLNRGVNRPGNARLRLGDEKLDVNTVMYHIGREIFGFNDGDSMNDNSCYIFAILVAAGCITRESGHINFR